MKLSYCYLILLFTLTACAPDLDPNTYTSSELGNPGAVEAGVIAAKRPIKIDNSSGTGTLAGGLAGGALGSTVSHTTSTSIVGGVGGALLGGLIGHALDKAIHKRQGYQYIIRMNHGELISVTEVNDVNFRVGDSVLVVHGPKTRLIPNSLA